MAKPMSFRVGVSRVIKAPLPFIYAWWTGFREGDPRITGQKRTIRILDHTTYRSIMAVRYERLGREMLRLESYLQNLQIIGIWIALETSISKTGDYKLSRVDRNRTRVSATYRVTNKNSSAPNRSAFRNNICLTWDKYAAALESEYCKQAET